MAAVTSDHKFRGSQQYKCITVYFWRSEVQDGFCWTRSRVYETTLFGYPLGENQFPCFSQLLKAAQFPWLVAPSSVFTADDVASSSLLLTLTLFLSSHLLPDSDVKSFLPRKVTYSQVQRLILGHLWGPLQYSVYHNFLTCEQIS